MLDIGYKRHNMVMQSVGCLFLAAGGAWLGFQEDFHWKFRVFGAFLALCLPFVSFVTMRKALSGQSAIAEIPGGLRLASLYGSLEFRWPQLRSIEREVLTQRTAFGLIKQNIAHYLVFVVMDPAYGEKRFKIHEDLIDVPKAELDQLYDRLCEVWEAGGSRTVPASRQPAIPAGIAPRAVGFGRKGL